MFSLIGSEQFKVWINFKLLIFQDQTASQSACACPCPPCPTPRCLHRRGSWSDGGRVFHCQNVNPLQGVWPDSFLNLKHCSPETFTSLVITGQRRVLRRISSVLHFGVLYWFVYSVIPNISAVMYSFMSSDSRKTCPIEVVPSSTFVGITRLEHGRERPDSGSR